jgi:uncharacterized membrane protein
MMEDAVMAGDGAARSVDSGRGVAWWSESWALFMKNPGMWLVYGLIVLVGFIVLNFVPLVGGLVAAVVVQVIVGGWVLCARKLDSGGAIDVNDLLSVFKDKDKLTPLLVLGALAAAGSLVIGIIVAVMGGGAVFGLMAGAGMRSTGGMLASAAFGLLSILVGLALGFVMGMALWFAAALVAFRGLPAVDALKASWSASLANVMAFLVYGVIWIVAAVIASIPFMLGWVLLAPLTMLGIYCSYKDIFEASQSQLQPQSMSPGQQ